MAYKRNRSSDSESDFYCKKVNLQTTSEKIIEFAERENMLEQSESNVLREEAINTVKNSAPEWFGGVFEFLLKDLQYLRSQSTGLQACNKKCEKMQNR